ncbi:MAG TPA: hypothetical protein VLH77_06270, partial [Gammaproteobacteria bacterium]|nr:hypothetical protein [Gammaproteobacteria bacterium]
QAVAGLTASTWLKQWFLFDGHYHIALKEGLSGIFRNPSSTYNSSLWTMYVELWGSLAIFSVVYLVENKYLRLLTFAITCRLSAHYFDRYEFFCIFAGAVSYNLHQLFTFPNKLKNLNTACVLAGLFLCSYPDFAPLGNGGIVYNWLASRFFVTWYHALGAVLIVHFIHGSTLFRKFFSAPPLLWLGKVSFSFYLLHLPVICSLGAGLIYLLHSTLSYNEMTFIVILSTGIVSLSLAALYEKSVDRLFIRLGHWFSHKIDRLFPTYGTKVPSLATAAS